MSVRVTVGIPFLNAEATLADAIRSVFAQTHTDWDLLLVDDGSTDRSLELARSVRDPRVTVVSDGRNLRLPDRLNQIARLARTELVARMDADDLMHPERLAAQLAFLRDHPEVEVLGSAAFTVDAGLGLIGLRGGGPSRTEPRSVFASGLFLHPTVMARTGWMLRNPYDPSAIRAEDFELWCRTSGRLRAACLDAPLLFYRESLRVNLAAYLASARTTRAVLRRHGPERIGVPATVRLVARSGLKSLAYRGAYALGWDARLVRARSRAPTPEQRQAAAAAMAAVLATEVPGLEPAATLPAAG